jgi:tRNA-dihydrouridine synthase B
VAELHAFYGNLPGLRIARKHIGWYLKSLSAEKQIAARSFRNQLMTIESASSQLELIEQWFATVSSQIEQQAA